MIEIALGLVVAGIVLARRPEWLIAIGGALLLALPFVRWGDEVGGAVVGLLGPGGDRLDDREQLPAKQETT
jgi:hypothetical protein